MVTCRECEREINQATEICPHCGADLTFESGTEEIVSPRKKPTVAKILLRWGLLLGVILGAMWSFLWFVASPRTGEVTLNAEIHAVQAMSLVHHELDSYAAAQGGVYPSNLEALGTPARQAAQLAQGDGYSLEYTPGAAEADGGIHGYTLQARAGNYGYRSFFSDASGVVHATRENREASGSDPAIP
jgi:RNA polymerase subunit RPABC4/transcription elongation factor Spt4